MTTHEEGAELVTLIRNKLGNQYAGIFVEDLEPWLRQHDAKLLREMANGMTFSELTPDYLEHRAREIESEIGHGR